MGNQTASLRVILEDDVTPGARKVESALEKLAVDAKAVDKALAGSGTSDKFARQLRQIGATTTEVQAAAKAWENYAKAEGLAADRGKWTAEQAAGVRRWESATVGGVRAVMAVEKTLEDERGKAHASRVRALEAEEIRAAGVAKRRVEAEHRAQERIIEQREHGQEHHGFKNYALMTAAMAVSAHSIMHGVETVLEHGAEYQHRLVALQNAGRSPAEIAQMNEASHAALRGVPTATLTGNLEILNETVGAFGSVEHAIEHLGFMAKSSAILHAVAGEKIGASAGELGNQLARFFEMRGTAGNGEVFEHEASEMMKGMIFSGGNVNPRELLNFAQQAKSALQNYDIGFLSRVAPSLIGEVGGDRAGTQANAFNSVILGKARDKKQAAAWKNYGLIDPKQMSADGTGWTGGAIYHTDEALRDPLAFGEKYVLPALEKKGVNINDKLELTKVLGTLFRNINAAAFANELWQAQNRTRLHKDAGFIGDVESPDAIYKRLLNTDPTFAMGALKGAFGSFLTTLSSPIMGTAAKSLSGMAENLNELAIVAHNNPATAVTAGLATAAASLYAAGRLSYGLLNGFGQATFGAAAGEMATAGHEQLMAGRLQLSAAEASRAAALAHEIPGAVPIGGKAATAAERAVVREGTVLAEGAAEAAIGSKIVAAVEGGMKGGLAVGALEVAATAGVTLTAGSVALVGLTAAAIIGAIKASTEPKHQAAKDPGFGDPFAPGKGIDFTDPKYRDPDSMSEEEKRDAAKPWWNQGKAHPRGSLPKFRPEDQPGRDVIGPHGVHHYAVEDRDRIVRHAPYFSTAPLDENGHVRGMHPYGWIGDRVPVDPSTGSIFGLNRMPTDPRLYSPADVPLPPPRPQDFGPPRPLSGGDSTVRRGDNGWGAMRSDPGQAVQRPLDYSALTNPAPMAAVTPKVDTGPLDGAKAKAGEVHAALDGLTGPFSPHVDDGSITAAGTAAAATHGQIDALNTSVRPQVDNSSLRETLALLDQIHAKLGGMSGTVNIGTTGAGAALAATATATHRSFAPAPAGHIDV